MLIICAVQIWRIGQMMATILLLNWVQNYFIPTYQREPGRIWKKIWIVLFLLHRKKKIAYGQKKKDLQSERSLCQDASLHSTSLIPITTFLLARTSPCCGIIGHSKKEHKNGVWWALWQIAADRFTGGGGKYGKKVICEKLTVNRQAVHSAVHHQRCTFSFMKAVPIYNVEIITGGIDRRSPGRRFPTWVQECIRAHIFAWRPCARCCRHSSLLDWDSFAI